MVFHCELAVQRLLSPYPAGVRSPDELPRHWLALASPSVDPLVHPIYLVRARVLADVRR